MARPRSYRVTLTSKERKCIIKLKRKTSSENKKRRYAVILAADEKRHKGVPSLKEISEEARVSIPTAADTLKKYCTNGLTAAVTPIRNPASVHRPSARSFATFSSCFLSVKLPFCSRYSTMFFAIVLLMPDT